MALMDSLRPALGPVDRMPSRRCGLWQFLGVSYRQAVAAGRLTVGPEGPDDEPCRALARRGSIFPASHKCGRGNCLSCVRSD